jgi:thioredoxin-related protein
MRLLIVVWAAILACGICLPAKSLAAGSLVHVGDFKADAREAAKRQIPILVVFTSPGCHYCDRVKREYLAPMLKDPTYRKQVIIRELEVGSSRPLTLFDGSKSTEGAFAAEHKVFMVPTIMVFDTRGEATSEPIIGLLTPDYYFGYIQNAINDGLSKVRGK